MSHFHDSFYGFVDNPESDIYPELFEDQDAARGDFENASRRAIGKPEMPVGIGDRDEPIFTWKHDTNGNYYLCENSDYIIRPIWPTTCRVLWAHDRKDFDDLDEAKAWVETRVRAGL